MMNKLIKIAVIIFPGTNTERETFMAIQRAGMEPIEFLWNNDYSVLGDCQGYVIAGGFSYEDRSRAGIIASLDPIMTEIRKQAEKGKPVLGICNGAQVLVETGMVPGLRNSQLGMALAENKRTKDGHVLGTGYYNNWSFLYLSVPSERTAFTRHLAPNQYIHVPFAHAEGRFVMPVDLLNELISKDQTVFRYGDSDGNIIKEFPTNPNGSEYNLAAVCNPSGNVMALMPHPERTTSGDAIFTSMREYILEKIVQSKKGLRYLPNKYAILPHEKHQNSIEFFVESIITDNEAMSVQNALGHLGLPIQIQRLKYWGIESNSNNLDVMIKDIDKSGELYNSNKESLVKFKTINNTKSYLVKPKEDLIGRHKTELLKKHFNIHNISKINSGIVWRITNNSMDDERAFQSALDTNIFFNQFSHDCYEIQ